MSTLPIRRVHTASAKAMAVRRSLRRRRKDPAYIVFLTLLALACASSASAQPRAPIRYTVSFPDLRSHLIEVAATIPTDGERRVDLMMPVWTPGSYLVREYSRNVESMDARDDQGRTLPLEKTRKNRWRVSASGPSIHLRYRVYAHEMSVRTDWAD